MITPLQALKSAVRFLEKSSCAYCLIGGHAASLYRQKERLTKDVDFAIVADPLEDSQKIAVKLIKSMGLTPVVGFIPLASGESKRRPICMITSKPAKKEFTGIIDILLPELPWVKSAVERAQHNRIDLHFASVPVITPEDLIIAKCYALRNSPDRFQDLDDLKEIFTAIKDINFDYVEEYLRKFNLVIPDAVQKFR